MEINEMEHEEHIALLNLMGSIFETPSLLAENVDKIPPQLEQLVASAPTGLEGMAKMISVHFTHAFQSKAANVQKFELESGLIKYQTYLRKLAFFS
jgi:hypothetical protein